MKTLFSRYQKAIAKCLAMLALFLSFGYAAAASIYPAWKEGVNYSAGTFVNYSGHNYQALISHTSTVGAGWTPAAAPSLWQDLGFDSPVLSPSGYPYWAEGGVYPAGTIVFYQNYNYKAIQSHTAYIGTNWNPPATPSLWQNLGLAASQDTFDSNISTFAPVDDLNITQTAWEVPDSAPTGQMFTWVATYGKPVTVSNREWQVLDNGTPIFASHDFFFLAPISYPDGHFSAGRIRGTKILYLKQGTHNLTFRVCDSTTKKCFISAQKSVSVPASPVIPVPPPKPTLKFDRFIDPNSGLENFRPNILTPLTSNFAAVVGVSAQVYTTVPGTPLSGDSSGPLQLVTVASGCPALPNGQPSSKCYYLYSDPMWPSIMIPKGDTATRVYVTKLCHRYNEQCITSDPVTVKP